MSADIKSDIAKNMGWEPKAGEYYPTKEYLDQIALLTPEEAFEKWCTWHGFLGWYGTILSVVRNLQSADGDHEYLKVGINEGGILKNWVAEYLGDIAGADGNEPFEGDMRSLAEKLKAL